LVTDYPR